MKKLLFISALFIAATAFAQEKPKTDLKESAEKAKAATDKKFEKQINDLQTVKVSVDTVDILEGAKFIKIKERIYPVEAFTKSVPVFLSAEAWGAVLEIINSRDYGKIPATTIGQIIQAIGQQLPRKEN